MSTTARSALDAYLARRTPTGVPWWVYAVTLFVANGVRQLALWRLDATSATRIASFLAMLVVVVAAIDGAAAWRRAHREPERRLSSC